MWAWSEITSSSSCQPKACLVAKEIRRQDYEINSMAVGNVSCGHCDVVTIVTATVNVGYTVCWMW